MALSNSDQEDSFISDEEEEFCPLCVEEMDISDRNFKPCPCGYQVCQFCYNNIRQNPQLNGKCPACRRPYDDESVEYRLITPEEWKRENAKQSRRERERKQREREKKETELSSKKHLSGMRVIQKNLVYIIGLNPNISIEELHHTLRTDHFFGQYGKIQKIVINRRNNNNGTPGLGVYVTFSKKEDAARCIAAVDGMLMDGKYLRAAYGTTKYCSAYLRGQPCPNPNCMFLHEPGEEADSYSRQDLSTIQHVARQDHTNTKEKSSKPATKSYHNNTDHDSHSYLHTHNTSQDSHHSDRPSALPASVSWATKPSPSVAAAKLNLPSFPPLPAATKPASVPTPPLIVQPKPDPPIVVHREPPKPDEALKFMEDSLVLLCAPNYNYHLLQETIKTKKITKTRPLFAFSPTTSDHDAKMEQDLPSFLYTTYLPPFVYRPPPEPTSPLVPFDPATISQQLPSNPIAPHNLQQPSIPIPLPPPSQNHHQQLPAPSQRQIIQPNVNQSLTQLLDKIDCMRMQTPSPLPPPGLHSTPTENPGHTHLGSNIPSQNSQELLARLMKRDFLNTEQPVANKSIDAAETEILDVERMTINFLDEFDLLNEKDDINDKESFSESLDSDDLVETSTPKLDKVQTTGNNKISKAAISVNIKTEDSIANSSEDFEDTALVTKTVNTPVTVSKAIGTASSKADENTLVSSTVINSKNIESNTFDNKITESKNEEETEAKPTKRFTKPDPFAETAPILTKRQKKKLEQKMLLKESIRVREETQFVSGLGRRRHREASEEEKDTSASSSTVSTPSISKPEIGLSITTESQKTAPKVSHPEISKPKKTSKKFKKLDFSDLENLDDPSAEKFEPAWANEKSDVHSVADEVDKISREGKAKLASKEEPVSKVSPTLSPVSEFSKQENKPSVKETSEVADVKPSAKAKTSNKLISKIPSTETGKKPTELISLPVSVEENKPSLKSSTKTIASNSLNQKNNTEKISTREVKPILKELKSDASVTVVTPLSKKSNPAKQKKEDLVEESVLPTESVSISEGRLNLEEDDELIDTIVDPDFIEDLVSRTLQSTSSNFASFFNTNPQFITQSSPTFSSSEFESYTPDTDITTEEISMDLLCKLLSPNVEIKVDVSLEQAEECLKQSKKMLESLETSFVDSVKETAMAYKNIKKKDKH